MIIYIEYIELEGKYWIIESKWKEGDKTFMRLQDSAYLPVGVSFEPDTSKVGL